METTRGRDLAARLDAIGISKRDFADRAGVDRGTLDRALEDDPTMRQSTWRKIDQQLAHLEDEIGMAEGGHMIVSTVTIGDATVTMRGNADDVAEAVRRLLD